ncbi:DUF4194 domain-containing protein [Rummeliibacillus suwonensis]|uniref:DUF4194 domain-containing protein n=1 Tax=Rummeliibacillus suwonensis TaxID=1306154 RepID=UPI001AAE7F40|nr:DUF4194 domain-containing protein [Rummeliibacillus suwonensis]MBO2536542.1 DUF4194 domain-containing protein [Rummeliibacillus suwonensis]
MSDIKLNISIKGENNILFKRCVRKLLDSTFIVGDKDTKLYAFISRESNRQDVSDYLRMIGFDVLVDSNIRIAMLKSHEADEEAVGLKRANVVTFNTDQYNLLLVLWEMYLENLGYNDDNVVMLGDLVDKIQVYEVNMDSNKLLAAMKIFKKYDLIDYDLKDKSEDALITLYPSLQFGWNIAQFKTVSAEYMKNEQIEDDLEAAIDSDAIEEDVE